MTDDPKQDYFAEGMTADIITDLSHLRELFVIAQSSTSQFKGRAVDVREVGRELGVSHVLEGGIRRAGETMRVNVRLIDARSGAEVWAQRYDRPLDDIFAVQDEIGRKIVTELDVQLAEGEAARAWRRTTTSPEAYEYFLRAREARLRFTKEDVALAKQLSERALELDPEFAMAMVVLGRAHRTDAYSGWTNSIAESYETSLHWINRAIEIDPLLGEAYNTLGEIYYEYNVDTDRAIGYLRKAVELDPNSARNNIILAAGLGEYAPEEAVEYAKKAMRLSPNPPAFYFTNLGNAYFWNGQTDQAIEAFNESTARMPDFIWAHLFLTIIYAKANRLDEAHRQAKEVQRINPNFVAAESSLVNGLRDPTVGQEFLSLMQQAGLN
jgi:adenylate cyclase